MEAVCAPVIKKNVMICLNKDRHRIVSSFSLYECKYTK